MIAYIEKSVLLHEAITEAGHRLEQIDGIWFSDDDIAVQAIIDSYDGLLAAKKIKRAELRTEYRKRLILVYPDAEEIDESAFDFGINLAFDLYRSVIGSSRSPNADWQQVLDTRIERRNARIAINALTDVVSVQTYDVTNAPAWP